MQNYIAIIHKDEESCYGAHFPDIPGCISAGDTLDESVTNATEALRFYAEDIKSLPIPRNMEEIRADKEVQQDIAEGAILVAVPLLIDEGRSVRVNITMDAGLVKIVDEAAKARGLTRSGFLAQAAREKILEA